MHLSTLAFVALDEIYEAERIVKRDVAVGAARAGCF